MPFQIVRELLTNVVKHVHAGHVSVRIHRSDNTIQTALEDNGIGFDPPKVGAPDSKTGGFGLFSVRERVEYMGGETSWWTPPPVRGLESRLLCRHIPAEITLT